MYLDYLYKLFSSNVPDYFVELLEIEKKSELIKFCKELIVYKKDFVKLIVNSRKIGYLHEIKYNDFVPIHLDPTDEEFEALQAVDKPGKLEGKAKKFMSKIGQIFVERRYLVVHVFYNELKWHLFYFDQRDIEKERRNHWKEGSHIHFVNYLWPNHDLGNLWEIFDKSNASVGGKIHIKYFE